jgi:hypothetical protein
VARTRGGAEQSCKLSEAVALRNAFMGRVYIVFGDGTEARIDPYATNAPALLKTVADRLNPAEGTEDD